MRFRQITPAQQRLLEDVTGRISRRLESKFEDPSDVDGPNVGVQLRERGHAVVIEIPTALLEQAVDELGAREALRIRLKARRDRMLFRAPPSPLPKHIAPATDPFIRGGPPHSYRPMRGRR